MFWGPTTVILEDAADFVADDPALVTTAVLGLGIPVIDVDIPVVVRPDVLDSAVPIAFAEPPLEPPDGGERSSEVITAIDADIAAVLIVREPLSEAPAPVTEPAVISTR